MTKKERERQRIIIQRLSSADDEIVLRTITKIRETGNPNIIPALLELYQSTSSTLVRERIVRLISDLKSQGAVAPLVHEIFNIIDPELKRSMIEACWLSGLDFSKSLAPFFEVLLSDPYTTALEAFTVIENNLQPLDHTTLQGYGELLDTRIDQCSQITQPLARQLRDIINDTLLFSGEASTEEGDQ
jgi:HEAT repeat protein